MKTITFIAWNRPAYTRRLIEALRQCVGIEEYLLLPRIEPGNDEIEAMVRQIGFTECRPHFNALRLGIIQNTRGALRRAFHESDYVIHFEDDIIPAPDALRFFEWAGKAYEEDKTVFTVSGYNRSTPRDEWQHYMVKRRRWFHPWGWATWQDRWEEMESRWDNAGYYGGWGPNLNDRVRGERFEVFPVYARTQNVGAEDGYNVITPAWHRIHQYNAAWAGNDSLPPGNYYEAQGEMWTADQMASVCQLVPDGMGPTELRVWFDSVKVKDIVVVYGDDRAVLCAAGAGAGRVIVIPDDQDYIPPVDMLPLDLRDRVEVQRDILEPIETIDALFVTGQPARRGQSVLGDWAPRVKPNGKVVITGRLNLSLGWHPTSSIGDNWLVVSAHDENDS